MAIYQGCYYICADGRMSSSAVKFTPFCCYLFYQIHPSMTGIIVTICADELVQKLFWLGFR